MRREEKKMIDALLKEMGGMWDAQKHEDKYSEGIPDISFCYDFVNGWIEAKYIYSGNKPKKYTSQQINWSSRRSRHGGLCFILVGVGKTRFLFAFNRQLAYDIKGGMSLDEYAKRSIYSWTGKVNPVEFTQAIKQTAIYTVLEN